MWDPGIKQIINQSSIFKIPLLNVLTSTVQPAKVRHSRCWHTAPPQDIRQDSRALHVLNHQRNHISQLRFSQRMRQSARPVNVIDRRMRVLIVSQVHVLHGQHRQLVGSHRIATMFHVPCHGEQLAGGHDMRGSVNHDLISRLKRHRVVLGQCEGVQCAIRRILRGTLQGQLPGTSR